MKYKDAGVDIQEGNEFVNIIKPLAQKTTHPGVLAGIGGFASLYEIPPHRFKEPVLVSSSNGIGTKARLAAVLKRHENIGIDLVATCVNDILPCGGQPLYFLDYYATGHLHLAVAEEIMQGVARGCTLSEISLVGGETTEIPSVYNDVDYDLAGFVVGIVEKARILDGSHIKAGDILIALPSSGVHIHGFSLIHRLITENGIDLNQSFGVQTLGEALLTPTRIYVRSLLPLLQTGLISGCAHITGGGITANLPRVLPKGVDAFIDLSSFELPPLFEWIQSLGKIETSDMLSTFNCGVGMILVVGKDKMEDVITHLRAMGEQPWILGFIDSSTQEKPSIYYETTQTQSGN